MNILPMRLANTLQAHAGFEKLQMEGQHMLVDGTFFIQPSCGSVQSLPMVHCIMLKDECHVRISWFQKQ